MSTLPELAASKELFVNLTLRELRGKYKRSVLGWTWSLLNPLATMVIFTVVFRFFLKIEATRISRGKNTFLIRLELLISAPMAPEMPLERKFQGSSPHSRKMAKT